jgi:hypothetical protein
MLGSSDASTTSATGKELTKIVPFLRKSSIYYVSTAQATMRGRGGQSRAKSRWSEGQENSEHGVTTDQVRHVQIKQHGGDREGGEGGGEDLLGPRTRRVDAS